MKFCFDLDGTLNIYPKAPFSTKQLHQAEPNRQLKRIINRLYRHNIIIIHTSRDISTKNVTINWLKKHNIQYHKIKFNKPKADYYIDDKNLSIKEALKWF